MYCQKCRTLLKVDSSLEDLNPAAFDLLVGKSEQSSTFPQRLNYPQERKALYDRVSKQASSPVHKRTIPPPESDGGTIKHSKAEDRNRKKLLPDMSFIEITESQIVTDEDIQPEQEDAAEEPRDPNIGETADESGNKLPLSTQLEKNERLFSILSSHSDIDHPICSECTSLLLTSFNARLASVSKERDAYASFLKSLQQNSVAASTAEDDGEIERDLVRLQREDEEALETLKQLEQDKKKLEEELADLEEESRQLEIEEEDFWTFRNSYDDKLYELETGLTSLQQKFMHDEEQLERLQRTNVYNDTFCIGHDGYFGTINGLRLGRLPNHNVEWAEINAAWGQTLLLLATVAERLGFAFQGYRLRPLGSTSRIEKLEWPQQSPKAAQTATRDPRNQTAPANPPPKITQYDLFSSGDVSFGRILNYRRFDAGMVAFLDCLGQLGKHVERTSASVNDGRHGSSKTTSTKRVLPYIIQGEKIGDVSIRIGVGFQSDENFTKACKYALTCCKFLLAYVSNLESSKPV